MGNRSILHLAEVHHVVDVAELVDISLLYRDTQLEWLGCASRRPLR
jgi:hypothetical protein